MRFQFRFRSVTALTMLVCVAANMLWMPTGMVRDDLILLFQVGQSQTDLWRVEVIAFVAVLAVCAILSAILLFASRYSKGLAWTCMLWILLCLMISVFFHFTFPAMWLLPLWASWRLSGSPLLKKST